MTRTMRFPALRFMIALKAAREFGLADEHADAIALRFDAREPHCEHLVDALATALVKQGAVTIPEFG